jgi:predicted MFS family arabinose efflux permease
VSGDLKRGVAIGLISFFTLIDLFAAQAILPTLAAAYEVSPAVMGSAVNASTLGMAFAGLIVALVSKKINRRAGVWISLALLSVPTVLLAHAPDITSFAILRVAQGVFMATAFTLTMAYLAEECTAEQAAGAMAAYITGNVASNLVGRLAAAAVVNAAGLEVNFYVFAALNLAGAALAFASFTQAKPRPTMGIAPSTPGEMRQTWLIHLGNRSLAASFAIGFLILFIFIGVFTYINFVLARAPFELSPAALGVVYLVFIPSMITTPFAGAYAAAFGVRPACWLALIVTAFGLSLTLVGKLWPVACGLALVAAGLFFAQAVATAFVGRAAIGDRTSASGLYLGSYYLGGLAGSVVVGVLFNRFGWIASVAAAGAALMIAAWLGRFLTVREAMTPARSR